MRLVWLCLLGCHAARPAPVPGEPLDRRGTIEYTIEPAADDGNAARRAQVLRELEEVDKELDAIDDELAADAIPGPATRDAALALVTARGANLARTAPDTLFEDTPVLLVRTAHAYFEARGHDVELAKTYGERHPERIEQRAVIATLAAAFDRQREVEIALLGAWRDELGKLPAAATTAKVRQANRRALQATIARFTSDGIVPSDAPAELRVAAARIADATQQLAIASRTLGPKHPDRIALDRELAAARAALQTATAGADAAFARELAALDRPRPRPANRETTDPARLARRAELAARARELRREWDALR